MNKKGFTLIELIAVVVIMSIIAIIATPNIINMIDKGKKEQYITDTKEFISKATYMYKQDKYRNDTNYFTKTNNSYKITLNKIEGIKQEDYTDPYGYTYNKQGSYIIFEEPSENTTSVQERTIKVHIESNDGTKCYVVDNEKSDLDTNSVVEGTFAGGYCTK